jgi:hypothetical protein
MIGVGFRLEAGLRLDPFFLLWKWRKIRVPSLSIGSAVGGGMLLRASSMVGCRDALLIARGEGFSGREPQADAKMSLQRGAMVRSDVDWPENFVFKMRQSSGLLDESNVLIYLRA